MLSVLLTLSITSNTSIIVTHDLAPTQLFTPSSTLGIGVCIFRARRKELALICLHFPFASECEYYEHYSLESEA